VVVAVSGKPDGYLVIDGYKRVVALEQLGRDTVEAVIWPISEAEALVLERSMRLSERDTALEQGWLLADLDHRFGYSLDDLARRFDRSTSWVSRRLALVELLPKMIQQKVRMGEIPAHVAMKFWCRWRAPTSRIANGWRMPLRGIASRAGKPVNSTPHGATLRRRSGSGFWKSRNCFSKHSTKSSRSPHH
jgi:hypothetical protein